MKETIFKDVFVLPKGVAVYVESLWDSDRLTNVTSSIVTFHNYIPSYPTLPPPIVFSSILQLKHIQSQMMKIWGFFLTNLLFLPQGGGAL
jgi:hypothetical protein